MTGRLADGEWVVDAVEAPGSADQDRVSVMGGAEGLVLSLADGAGGTSHGREAAEMITAEAMRARFDEEPDALLRALDRRLHAAGGQSTAVIARIAPDASLVAAVVGDSELYGRMGARWVELTARHPRKPLVGSGRAQPSILTGSFIDGVLIASDGLTKYAAWPAIAALIEANAPELPWQLVEAARLPSGSLQDDVSFIVARRAPTRA